MTDEISKEEVERRVMSKCQKPNTPTLRPGDPDPWGLLTLGNSPELVNAMAYLDQTDEWGLANDKRSDRFHHSVAVALSYSCQALLSPEGRRLYPEEAARLDAHFPNPEDTICSLQWRLRASAARP